MSLVSDTQSGFESSVDSSVGVNTLQAKPLESQGSFPRTGRDFSLLHSMQTDYEDYLPFYPALALRGKQLRHETAESLLCTGRAEVKNVLSPVSYTYLSGTVPTLMSSRYPAYLLYQTRIIHGSVVIAKCTAECSPLSCQFLLLCFPSSSTCVPISAFQVIGMLCNVPQVVLIH
jgi:hypothetical protein